VRSKQSAKLSAWIEMGGVNADEAQANGKSNVVTGSPWREVAHWTERCVAEPIRCGLGFLPRPLVPPPLLVIE